MENPLKATLFSLAALLALASAPLTAQDAPVSPAPPPSTGGIFPLNQVQRGLHATAWTVFSGTVPEPMDVEILGVLRGARGPGQDMILARLHGAKPEYTGVVAGMSGSPVYIGNKLLGSLSYRIGEFSKEPIAGITPIEQMLEVRDLPIDAAVGANSGAQTAAATTTTPSVTAAISSNGMNFQAMETPLTLSGFRPEAIQLWQQKMAGTGLDLVAAGGSGSSSTGAENPAAAKQLLPGSAVSAQLIRGDLEISATCTVTYIDPKQLLACGHPLLQAGTVSLPMTTAEVVTTLASPLNAFKIVNTGEVIGAFTEDRDAAIRGVIGAEAHMIPVHLAVHGAGAERKLNIEILDLPSVTPQALMVAIYESLLETNQSTADNSYHITGKIELAGTAPVPIDLWAQSGEAFPAPLMAALLTTQRFAGIYLNPSRDKASTAGVDLSIEAVPHTARVELTTARFVSSNIAHAGEMVEIEATLQPWQKPARNVRISVPLPARLAPGNLRILISDAGTLDRTLDQPRQTNRPLDLETLRAQALRQHDANRVYVSLLAPETQASVQGQPLTSLPLSVANALEPLRASQDVNLNGESALVLTEAPAEGAVSGFQILNLRIEAGGGLN